VPIAGAGTLPVLLALAVALPLLQGCGAVVVGGVAAGAMVAHDRRDYIRVLEDQDIEIKAMQIMSDNPDIDRQSRIAVTSYNLVVLLTGQAETRDAAARFADKVSRLPRVRRVVDEVTIGPYASLARQSEDALLTSRVKVAVSGVDLPGFDATRVKVVTESGIVYLMGMVTPTEADAAVEKARYVSGVKKVVKVFEYIQPPSPKAAA